jgi:polyphosphate kinase 2 (PPK2 family)
LWRIARDLPERGRIGIFNRSHYEEVLTVRVNPQFLDREQLPHIPKDLDELWAERHESICGFERHLARNGTIVLKFFLNVSQKEQHRRFRDRIEDPDDNWKFRPSDWEETQKWDRYMDAYEATLRATSKPWAPWYCIPADNKPYMRRVVAEIVVETLARLPLEYPRASQDDRAFMDKIKRALEAELRE